MTWSPLLVLLLLWRWLKCRRTDQHPEQDKDPTERVEHAFPKGSREGNEVETDDQSDQRGLKL